MRIFQRVSLKNKAVKKMLALRMSRLRAMEILKPTNRAPDFIISMALKSVAEKTQKILQKL